MLSQAFVLFAVAIAATPALAQTPTCYPTGSRGSASCARFVDDFCTTVSTIKNMRDGESTSRCFMVNNHRCDFTAYNTGNGNNTPDINHCKSVLNDAIQRCPMGGKGKARADLPFSYTVDPNAGNCGTDVMPGA